MDDAKNIFSCNNDIKKNAYMNWLIQKDDYEEDFYLLAESYANASKFLIEYILNDNNDKKADRLIFPVFYNFNQSIELYEKCIIRLINRLNQEKIENDNTHDIKQLFGKMNSKIKNRGSHKGLKKHIESLENYIKELYTYIGNNVGKPDMDFARYPIKTTEIPHFYINKSDNIVVNIERLLHVVNEVIDSLDALVLMYTEELKNMEGQ